MESQIFRIVFEDSSILVIEKARPFLSQRGDRGSKEGLDEFLARTLKIKIHPVHRLDREVLGLMIYGKTKSAAEDLSDQFRHRSIQKIYWAEVQGSIVGEGAQLVHFLSKNEKTNRVTVYPRETPGAKRAELAYRVLHRRDHSTELLVKLKTGRPHQIRAQLAKIGHPIVGDTRYGKQSKQTDRLLGDASAAIQLKSIYLGIVHPTLKTEMSWCLLTDLDPNLFFSAR